MRLRKAHCHRRAQRVNKYNPSKSAQHRNVKMYAELIGNYKNCGIKSLQDNIMMYIKVQVYLQQMVMVEKMYHGTIKMIMVIGTAHLVNTLNLLWKKLLMIIKTNVWTTLNNQLKEVQNDKCNSTNYKRFVLDWFKGL